MFVDRNYLSHIKKTSIKQALQNLVNMGKFERLWTKKKPFIEMVNSSFETKCPFFLKHSHSIYVQCTELLLQSYVNSNCNVHSVYKTIISQQTASNVILYKCPTHSPRFNCIFLSIHKQLRLCITNCYGKQIKFAFLARTLSQHSHMASSFLALPCLLSPCLAMPSTQQKSIEILL